MPSWNSPALRSTLRASWRDLRHALSIPRRRRVRRVLALVREWPQS